MRAGLAAATATTTGATLSALYSFTVNGSTIYNFPGGAFPLLPGTITSAGTLYFAGTYILGASFSGSFTIVADDVTLSGGASHYTITGNVSGDGANAVYSTDGNYTLLSAATPGYSFNLSNIHVTGNVSSIGGSDDWAGGQATSGGSAANGGNVHLTNATVTGTIDTHGGTNASPNYGDLAGTGGNVTLTDSTSGAISAYGGDSNGDFGGNGGTSN